MLEAYIDGGCGPVNPGGTASYGILVRRYYPGDGAVGAPYEPVWQDCGIVGSGPKMSNNVGEYSALVKLLEWLDKILQPGEEVVVLSDSQMVVNQMKGEWQAKLGKLYYPYYRRALSLLVVDEFFERVKFKWVPREQNLADKLSVRALAEVGIQRRR